MTRRLWSGGCTSRIAHKTFLNPLYISASRGGPRTEGASSGNKLQRQPAAFGRHDKAAPEAPLTTAPSMRFHDVQPSSLGRITRVSSEKPLSRIREILVLEI